MLLDFVLDSIMTRKFALPLAVLCLLALVPLGGCSRLKRLPFLDKSKQAEATPAPAQAKPSVQPAPAAVEHQAQSGVAPQGAKQEVNTKASAMVLCYHRFEDRPKDSLAIKPSEFESQLQLLKENGFSVISMSDFLAWRRGTKDIPVKSCVISIDDGYRSGYEVAWPLLKKFGYPFTMFVYTNYVRGQPRAGGQSISWEELAEMRDAGVDIESHTVSHLDLRVKRGKTPAQFEQWVREELVNSKKMIESQLGISVKCLAYPYGGHNAEVRRIAMEVGYDLAFTVYGQRLTYHSPADQLGRYAIEGAKPQIFQSALKMIGGGGGAGEDISTVGHLAASSMITQPMDGETVTEARPKLKANISGMAAQGAVEPGSIEMRLSGVGPVPVTYDPASGIAEGTLSGDLKEASYTVILSAKSAGRRVEARWSFNFSRSGQAPAPEPPPVAPVAVPVKGKKR